MKKSGLKERFKTTVLNNGKIETKLEYAKKMKENGVALETISNITGMSAEDIKKL